MCSSAEAWAMVMKAVRLFGWPRESDAIESLAAVDPLAARAVQSIGWRRLCLSTQIQLIHERDFFCISYERGLNGGKTEYHA